jgi:hypothetical protein
MTDQAQGRLQFALTPTRPRFALGAALGAVQLRRRRQDLVNAVGEAVQNVGDVWHRHGVSPQRARKARRALSSNA